ncbi:MAG: helix-turn-helix transcriptional regulator [Erysipelotrichales bacterium]|nr:helix-turn-helix transcriptional regulator [Erysipelotrichales bacterium]
MFSENLKTQRIANGFSQEQLATRLNVVRQTISKWEKGVSVPDAEQLVRIADVLGVQVHELLGKEIPVSNEKSELEIIALELSKLNELIVTYENKASNLKMKVGIIIGIVVVLWFGGDILKTIFNIGIELGKAIGDVLWK